MTKTQTLYVCKCLSVNVPNNVKNVAVQLTLMLIMWLNRGQS